MGRLQQLHEAGVSIWLDTLSRELLETGDFETLVRESAVTGATSNPTIFTKAAAAYEGLDLEAIALDLEREGIESFCGSYRELLRCIETKLAAISGHGAILA